MDGSKEGFDFQVVSIVGEQVSFVPTKLSPLETAIVQFDEYYKPEGISEEDFRILKNTMKFLFSSKQKPLGESKETTREIYPPCQEKEKQLVLESLLHRKRVLQQQMFDLGVIMYPEQLQKKINELRNDGKLDEMLRRKQELPIRGKETLLGDYHLQHWLALDRFIQDYDSQALCIDILDISHKGMTLDLTDDTIRELLQQFVFFMLQGSHPLPDYNKTDPTSPAFISRLKRNPMGDKFPTYLTTYKSKKLPISPIIAKVLEATNLDPASMRNEVNRLVDEEKKKILIVIQQIIPPRHPIWRSIGDKTDIRQIVETLWQNLQDADSLIDGLRKEIETLKERVKNCEKAQALLTIQKRRLDIRIQQLTAELVASQDSDLAKTRRIEKLEEEKRILEERIRANQAAVEEARGKDASIAQLRTEKQEIEDELAQTNLELLEEREKVGTLEEEKRLCQEELARVKAQLEEEQGKDAVIASLNAEKHALTEELEGLKAQITDLEAAVEAGKAKNATIADLQKQLADLQAQFADLEGKKTTLEEELARANADLEKEKGKDAILAELEAKKRELEARVAALEEELGPLRGKNVEVETLRAEEKEAQDALNQRIADLEREKQECQAALEAKEREYDQLLLENQDLKGEIFAMRNKVEDLEELNTRAQQNIDDLRREHQAALGVEKAKVVASEAARAAAMQAAEDASTKLAAKTTELADAKASLDATKKLLETKEGTVADLRKALTESEAAVTNARGEVQAKTDQIQMLTTEALAATDKLQSLETTISQLREEIDELRAEKEMMETDLESKLEQMSQLERQLAEAQAANHDLQTQLKKCEDEKQVLQQSASGAATSTAELAGKLRVAEEDRAAAQSKISELEASIQSLRRQLATETARANQAEETTNQQKKTIAEHEETIRYFEHDIATKQGELEVTGKRAGTAEKKVGELETKLTATITDKDKEITAVKDGLQAGFQQQLADQQSQFETALRTEKKELQDSLEASAAAAVKQTQEEYEAALQQQKENYEKVYAVIQRIATWIDSGEDTGVEEAAAVEEDTPQAGPLRTIVTKLGEVYSAASRPASPTARKTADSTISLCYIVFLASFLWQTNFPPHALEAESRATAASAAAGDASDWEALHSNRPQAVVPRLKLLHAILPTVFDGGAKPAKETWATSTSSPAAYAFRQGLYRDIEMRSAGATTKHEFHGHLYSENSIVRRFLHLFNKISRAMESPAPDGSILGLDEIDTVFLDQLVAKLTTIITDYKDVYRTPTFQLETAFPQMISETLRMNQPLVKADVLKHYVVKTRAGYKLVTKGDKEEAPSYLNYATIFYCFLVVIRDYLNHIEGTVYAQCPLPAILRRTKSRK
jgi:predicted  nucleic acid-binding Zn-ribbon protein